MVREICDQVLQGQGVGVFTYPKLKRLMEDESLREQACSKLNLGLDHKHSSEDEDIEDVVRLCHLLSLIFVAEKRF